MEKLRTRWIIGQARVGAPHDFSALGAGVENQHRMHAIRPDHRGVAHARLLLQHALHVLGKNVEPLRRHDHFLLAAQDAQLAVVLQLADIAGVEPAVFKGARGLLGMLEIAGGHVLAAHQDFAVRRDLHFDAADRLAHAALARVEGMIQRHDGRGLG